MTAATNSAGKACNVVDDIQNFVIRSTCQDVGILVKKIDVPAKADDGADGVEGHLRRIQAFAARRIGTKKGLEMIPTHHCRETRRAIVDDCMRLLWSNFHGRS